MQIADEIKAGESKILELKEDLPARENIAKTVIAFSNTSGGKLIIGVNDQREVVGLKDTDIFDLQDKISQIIYDNCYPHILPEIYTANIDNKQILVIQIFRGNLLPYYLKNSTKKEGTYIRIGATNRKAGFENIIELERQKRNRSFDEEINYDYEYASLDLSPIKNKFAEINKNIDYEDLKNLKLIKEENGKIYPSNGLLIILGKFENTLIKCSRFKGLTMDVFIDRKEYSGDLFSQIEATENFIMNHLNLKGEIKGLQRTDRFEIPLEAIREALINAVIHRDYSNMGRDIKIGIYDDILNIVSPGGLPNTLTRQDISNGRSEVRNRVIARVFKELGYIEQWGTGIKRIKSSCLNHGLKEPLIDEKGDFVDVEIYRKVADNGGRVADNGGRVADIFITDQEKKVLAFIEINKTMISKDLEDLFEIKNARARRILQEMTDKNLIIRKGSGRNTYYLRGEE